MAKRWCVNFDVEPVLQHGLAAGMWLMQYQYSHGGYDFQGHSAQISKTTANWNILKQVEAGDWFLAFLPESRFFGIGEVVRPRARPRHAGAAEHTDSVVRTVRDHSHLYFDGVVRYSDAVMLYEDFTDTWKCLAAQNTNNQPETWQYPGRIDVREWECVAPNGVRVKGLSGAASFLRNAVFEITEVFFETVVAGLRGA